jgi:hypothetical protein
MYTLSILDRDDEYVYGILILHNEEELYLAMERIRKFDYDWYQTDCEGDYFNSLYQSVLKDYTLAFNYEVKIR